MTDPDAVLWPMLQDVPAGRGLHSSTFRLNLSALYGIGLP